MHVRGCIHSGQICLLIGIGNLRASCTLPLEYRKIISQYQCITATGICQKLLHLTLCDIITGRTILSCHISHMKICITIKTTDIIPGSVGLSPCIGQRILLIYLFRVKLSDIVSNIDQVIITVQITTQSVKLCRGHMINFNLSLKVGSRQIFSGKILLCHDEISTWLNLQDMHRLFILWSYLSATIVISLILKQIMNDLA